MIRLLKTLPVLLLTVLASCAGNNEKTANAGKHDVVSTSTKNSVNLPAPYATESVAVFSNVIGWPDGKTPIAPKGFTVTKFADGLRNPRWIYVAENGDIFIAESSTEKNTVSKIKDKLSGKAKAGNEGGSADRITLLRDVDNDGIAEVKKVFLKGLNQPFGMLILNKQFYVANTDGVLVFNYTAGDTNITAAGKTIIKLPAGGYNNHWTRNIVAHPNGSKIFVSVGSASNVAEHGMETEVRRANILEFNPDGSNEKVYASGLRNPMGLAWAPGTNRLWTTVNERDGLGDNLVPDYLTSVTSDGFYGWPYSYWGPHEDPRIKEQKPALVKKALVPDVNLGAHTASLGLAFNSKKQFPGKYTGGAFVGQHGSWNRSALVGYQVGFVSFANGKPTSPVEPFLTGFIADSTNKNVYGRPVGVAFNKNGLLVADDAGNTIWMVKPATN